jgi:hypothetical protein
MAAIAVTSIPYPSGNAPAFVAANAGGDTVVPGDRTRLIVRNGSGASINVTIPAFPATLPHGAAMPALVVAVPAGGEKWIGPLSGSQFANPANGLVAVQYSAVTTVTVAAISD